MSPICESGIVHPSIVLDFGQNHECDQKPGFYPSTWPFASLKPVDSSKSLARDRKKPGFLSVVESPNGQYDKLCELGQPSEFYEEG